MKKIISILLTLSMILSLCVTVHADEIDDYLIAHFDTNGDGNVTEDELTFKDTYVELQDLSNSSMTRERTMDVLSRLNMENCYVYINDVIIDDYFMQWLMHDESNHYHLWNIGWYVTKDESLLEQAMNKKSELKHGINSIESLHVGYTPPNTSIAVLSYFNIPEIRLQTCDFTNDDLTGIDFTDLANSINSLDPYGSRGEEIKALLKCMPSTAYVGNVLPGYVQYVNPDIPVLNISAGNYYSYYTDEEMKFPTSDPFSRFTNLQSVYIYYTDIPEGINLSPLGEVTYLDVFDCNIEGINLSPLGEVTYLDVSYCNIDENAETFIDAVSQAMPKLKDLNINGTKFKDNASGDEVLEYIADKLPGLTTLNMRDSKITDLAPVAKFTNCTFDFRSNWIALAKGNNRQISENLRTNGKLYSYTSYNGTKSDGLDWQGGYTSDSQTIPGTEISVSPKLSKTTYLPGDTITETVVITNNGSAAETVQVAFAIKDTYDVTITNGDEQQSKVIAPGQTVHVSLMFTLNEGFTGTTYYGNFAVASVGKKSAFLNYRMEEGKLITLNNVPPVSDYEKTRISGTCSSNVEKVEIQLSDGTKLCDATLTGYGYFYVNALEFPESLWPTKKGSIATVNLKAVATDTDGNTFSSTVKSTKLGLSPDEEDLNISDYRYAVYGTNRWFVADSFSVVYQGDRIFGRVKIEGAEDNEISYVKTYINDKAYDMKKITEGVYKGYYFIVTDAIQDEDYVTATLEVKKTTGEIIRQQMLFARVIIDPSGIISDKEGDPIEGVQVTIYKQNEDTKAWEKWDAENYLQENPVYTNAEGYYGWDVPKGTYKVKAEKEGYKTVELTEYESKDNGGELTKITIPPPRLDVDITMEYADDANPPQKLQNTDTAKQAVIDTANSLSLPSNTTASAIETALNENLTENMYVSVKPGTLKQTDSAIQAVCTLENLWTGEMEDMNLSISVMGSETEPVIATDYNLTQATFDTEYNTKLYASGGEGSYTWSAVSPLPQGLKLQADGTITGKPLYAVTYPNIKVKCTDGTGNIIKKTFKLKVAPKSAEFEVSGSKSFEYDGQPHQLNLICTNVPDLDFDVTYGAEKLAAPTAKGSYCVNIKIKTPGYRAGTSAEKLYITIY